jgi:hypothetical protein
MPDNTQGIKDEIVNNSGCDNSTELLAIVGTESNFKPTAVSYTGVQGIFQITHATWNAVHSQDGHPYSLNVTEQAQTACKLLGSLHAKYDDTDPKLTYLAYNAGEGTADEAKKLMKGGMTYDEATLQALKDHYPNNPTKWDEGLKYAYKVQSRMGQNNTVPNSPPTPTIDNSNGADLDRESSDFITLSNQDISNADFDSLTPDVVITEGLDEVAWFNDTALLTGNPRVRSFVTPVAFQLLLKEKGGFSLSNPATGEPIEVQLNASLKSFNISSKHIFHKQNTRTAFHITMWGMQPDLIEGQGSTGVFMNQFGLTDFLSTGEITDEIRDIVSKGFTHSAADSTSGVNIVNATADNPPELSNGMFRVAAQDAFVEFLSLFKNNGNVWFYNKNYNGYVEGRDPAGPAAWSPKVGGSNSQLAARNNDVMTKGYIAMKLKDTTYLGYFKSLSWTMDAKNPFQWNFNFVFQVERTLGFVFYPYDSGQQ